MTEKKLNELAKKIKIAMLETGLNQASLAKKLGVKQNSVSRYLSGQVNPKIKMLEKIALATNKPVNYFFADDSITQNIKGNHNVQQNTNGQELELIKAKMEVLQKTLENFELRLKLLEKKEIKK